MCFLPNSYKIVKRKMEIEKIIYNEETMQDIKKIMFIGVGLLSNSLYSMEKGVLFKTDSVDCCQEALDREFLKMVNYGSFMSVKRLLEQGASVDAQMRDTGDTALHLATQKGMRDIVDVLIQYGADVFALNTHGTSVFDCTEDAELIIILKRAAGLGESVYFMKSEPKELLSDLGKKYKKESREKKNVKEGAEDAMDEDSCEEIKSVKKITAGAPQLIPLRDVLPFIDVHECIHGETALHHFFDKDETMVRALLEKGADINALSKDGETVLMRAIKAKKESLVSFLLDHDPDINAQNPLTGQTALMLAASQGREFISFVTMLIKHDADQAKMDYHGRTFINYLEPDLRGFVGLLLDRHKKDY